jgi:hypothetical protein
VTLPGTETRALRQRQGKSAVLEDYLRLTTMQEWMRTRARLVFAPLDDRRNRTISSRIATPSGPPPQAGREEGEAPRRTQPLGSPSPLCACEALGQARFRDSVPRPTAFGRTSSKVPFDTTLHP